MNDRSPPDEFADVNEVVGDEWEAETTPYERIRHVIARTYSPVSADTVSEDARTAPKTARKHLDTLADEGFVEATAGERGGTLYRGSTESLVVEQAADILDNVSTDELVTRIQAMRAELEEYRSEFGVDSPAALAVDRTNQALSGPGSAQDEIDPETIREWKTLRRNLAFANAALSIGNAEEFVDGDLGAGAAGQPPTIRAFPDTEPVVALETPTGGTPGRGR